MMYTQEPELKEFVEKWNLRNKDIQERQDKINIEYSIKRTIKSKEDK